MTLRGGTLGRYWTRRSTAPRASRPRMLCLPLPSRCRILPLLLPLCLSPSPRTSPRSHAMQRTLCCVRVPPPNQRAFLQSSRAAVWLLVGLPVLPPLSTMCTAHEKLNVLTSEGTRTRAGDGHGLAPQHGKGLQDADWHRKDSGLRPAPPRQPLVCAIGAMSAVRGC